MSEKIIKSKQCSQCNISFDILEKDLEFYDKISPVFNWKKYNIPEPTLCPDCRQQRRLVWRNERNLYRRKCDLGGNNIISVFSPDKPYKVYDHKIWWSDEFDWIDYGKDFDSKKTFFEQFKGLDLTVPKLSIGIQNCENCDFTTDIWDSKDCYMSFRTHYCDNIIHSYRPNRSSNCVDCYQVKESENLYECFECDKCQNSKYLYKCNNSHSSYFLWNCTWCHDCILCYNQTNTSYCILNKNYSKEEYNEKIIELKKNTKIDFSIFNNSDTKNITTIGSENFNWNYIYNSENIYDSFNIYDSRDCKYCFWLHDVSDCYDVEFFWFNNLNHAYDSHVIWNGWKNILFWNSVVNNNTNIYYSENIYNNSENIFWCFWLDNKKYCILNKQYSKEKYEKLVPKIINNMKKDWEWWEFFPSNISPFGYNETIAMDYYPITSPQPSPLEEREFRGEVLTGLIMNNHH